MSNFSGAHQKRPPFSFLLFLFSFGVLGRKVSSSLLPLLDDEFGAFLSDGEFLEAVETL